MMKNLLKGVVFGSLIIPVATIVYQIVAWFAYNFSESELSFLDMLLYSASNGMFGVLSAFAILCLYALPIFFILRYFKFANLYTALIVAIIPWVIIDGLVNKDIHHFIEFTWYSLSSATIFWFFVKDTIKYETENT